MASLKASGFSTLINMAWREMRISRARVRRSGVSVTHLFFAVGSVLFGEASVEGANIMKEVVTEYEEVSRQLVNFDKFLIYFSGNMGHEV
ncbi:hypothetical protein J1N35_044367 [Gossypium stocksii]|uniref:Uncharacterized protein n=1 Tax=Gossypium stocksii TaxID=47602 RepID=A0A9D3U9C6_9ROSI|nr:hypothetical protein J1N35_044367 [Gossypium stocksii]